MFDQVPFGFSVAGAGVGVPGCGVPGAGVGVPGAGVTGAGVTGGVAGVLGVPGFVTGGAVAVGGVVVVAGGAATSGIFRSLGSVGTHANSRVNRVRSIGIGVFPSPSFLPTAVAEVSPRGPPIVLALEGGPFGYHITTSIGGSCVMTGCEIPMSEIGTRGPIVSRCL